MAYSIGLGGLVRENIAAGGWNIAWGDLINEFDLLELIISVPTGTTLGWVEDQVKAQIGKFGQSFKDISPEVVKQAALYLKNLLQNNRSGQTEISGLGVKAGFATYNRWFDFGIGRTKLGNNHQPYIGVRVVKPLPLVGTIIPKPPVVTPPAVAGGLDPHSWYKLWNEGRLKNEAGNPMALDVMNDGNQQRDGKIQMATAGDFSGQYWQFRPSKIIPGTYNICCMWLGTSMALDVYGNDKTLPHLAVTGAFSGQQWHVESLAGGYSTLTNEYSSTLILATDVDGTGIYMKDPPVSAASHWVLQKVRPITENGFGG
ncbi:hypothetical protein LTR56_021533 [Elasticomyces elasticus]|nr:hypothetical protein LTR56_021533 [Elasticomyces elasticus]KAK3631272.1 hypothetical protein LTR22_021156 [Elasticomyces elasticus]KAK4909347.1 hypothetical protein LTR49_021859 [Elasticomyces elasticus]KAK5749375.1 hypothetical protein LTS12_020556 [Elasticomyces elasticus]